MTPYLVIDLEQNVGYVGLAFIFASATGPTCGVLFGGWLVDKFGGYRGRAQAAVALRICCIFVVIALVCCILSLLGKTLVIVILFIWIVLFTGGAIVPPATGILMSCVVCGCTTAMLQCNTSNQCQCGAQYFSSRFDLAAAAQVDEELCVGRRANGVQLARLLLVAAAVGRGHDCYGQ